MSICRWTKFWIFWCVSSHPNTSAILIFLFSQIYTQNLCKIDCRIKRAKTSCGCVPHFYSFPFSSKKIERTCNITELLCLARNRAWFNATECNCMNLCESMILTKLNTKQVWHFRQRFIAQIFYISCCCCCSKIFNLIECSHWTWISQRQKLCVRSSLISMT